MMLDWLDAIPNLGVPGVPGVQPQKTATFDGTPRISAGVPGVPEHLAGTPGTPSGTPCHSAKPLKLKGEHQEHREHHKRGEVSRLLGDWHRRLSRLDACQAPQGWPLSRWQTLCDDACWLYENFASQAVREGWSAADLFGVVDGQPHWGGIADRLRGSRSLVMSADLACWRHFGIAERYARGACPDHQPLWLVAPAHSAHLSEKKHDSVG